MTTLSVTLREVENHLRDIALDVTDKADKARRLGAHGPKSLGYDGTNELTTAAKALIVAIIKGHTCADPDCPVSAFRL